MSTSVKYLSKARRGEAVPLRERERADARLAKLREARADMERARRDFEKAVVVAYERPGHHTAGEVAQAAGWSRPMLFKFLKGRQAA